MAEGQLPAGGVETPAAAGQDLYDQVERTEGNRGEGAAGRGRGWERPVLLAVMGVSLVGLAAGVGGALGLVGVPGWAGVIGVVVGGVALRRLLILRWGSDGPDLGLILCAVWLLLLLLAAVFADWLPLAEARSPADALQAPTLARPDLFSVHPLGTDRQGLDLLAGVIYGARLSLLVGLGAVLLGAVVGGTLGLIAGYRGGVVDRALSLLGDALLAFPPLILLMGLASAMEVNAGSIMLGLAVLVVPTNLRLARANARSYREREFVVAAQAIGAKTRRIISREIVPNTILVISAYGLVMVAVLIIAEASLSFLGLSVGRPEPTWGNMIAAGQEEFRRIPHLVFVPAIALALTIYSLNRVGDAARARWEH